TTYMLVRYSLLRKLDLNEETSTMMLAGLLLVFAEIIPKALYRENPNTLVPRFFPLLNFFNILLHPFTKIVSVLNSILAKVFRLPVNTGYHLMTREDISLILAETQSDELLQEHQREMLEEALEFSELKAENVMIHRTEMVALPRDLSVEEVIEIARTEGYTRFPVYHNDLDNIIGILIIYDLLKRPNQEKTKVSDLMRKAYFAPENMDVNKLLTNMQNNKVSMAIIVDAFGGTAGLVTIEDILEEIVGEIEDEYDTTTQEIEQIDDDNFIIQGFVEIDFLNDEYGMNLPDGDYETIAGLIIDKLAKIPTRKSKLTVGNWEIEIMQVTSNKILKVKLSRIDKTPDDPD
ncbi:MAG: HlyC/CorC family transporter, partial [Candidatus Cloacimonetes bacterium]|nr:HlyC/CorC family transporter [Candidatus Cloacimonadota bacterium]